MKLEGLTLDIEIKAPPKEVLALLLRRLGKVNAPYFPRTKGDCPMKDHVLLSKSLTRMMFVVLLVAPALLLADSHAVGGNLSAQERAEIVALLEESRNDTLTKLAALSDEQWKFKPGPDRWSAGEVAEHLYLTETGFHMRVDDLMAGKPHADWRKLTEGKTQVITQVIPDRTNRVKAPPEVTPKGEMTRADIISAYSAARSRMIERTEDSSKAYQAHLDESGTPLGQLSAAHWIRFAALHNQRHNKQIDEVMADAKFPK